MTRNDALLLGVVLGAAAVVGDLAESLIKREAGVKDSSTCCPAMAAHSIWSTASSSPRRCCTFT